MHRRTGLAPYRRAVVRGPSMVPTLHDGDVVLVRMGGVRRAGDVVLARFADLPGRLVVKRTVRPVGDLWWLVSDNPGARGDSASHGAADVLGRVVAVWPAGRRGIRRLVPRTVPAAP